MFRRSLFSALVAALLAMTTAPVGATPNDKLTHMTFSQSVQIPGTILDAGTYRFRLADATSSRQVMQVLSNDGSIVYSMFYTRADWRNKVTDESTVTFRETPAGVPAAVRTLFYGGESRGYEFVYGKGELLTVPEAVSQPLVTYVPTPAAVWPPYVLDPAEAFVESTPAAAPERAPAVTAEHSTLPAEPLAAPADADLPRTASSLPLMAIGGLLTLLTGLGAGLIRSRT